VQKVYVPDLLLIASHYKEWAGLGTGVGNFLAYGDFPADTSGNPATLWLPQGLVFDKDLGTPPHPLDHHQIGEYITHSWYNYAGGDGVAKHPWTGETDWNYTGPQPPFDLLDTDGKYSWLKAPRYNNSPMEVGPLARMVVAYAAGHERVRELVNQVLAHLQVGPEALFSTLGRVAARGIETLAIAEKMADWIDELETNISSGNLAMHNGVHWDPATWPSQAMGWGITEAPRGALGHWLQIEDGTISNYQCVVPSTWNGSPRDALGQRGPWEEALIGTPVADPQQPVEVLRTIHSFDPCMACAVHVLDADRREITQIRIV
jgi:[NiFe] hydrogenase large subunit/hydrogenase large subunit